MLTFINVNTKKQCYKQNRLSVIVLYPDQCRSSVMFLEARGRGLRFTAMSELGRVYKTTMYYYYIDY